MAKRKRQPVSFSLEEYLLVKMDEETVKVDRNRSEVFRRIVRGHYGGVPVDEAIKKTSKQITKEMGEQLIGVSFELDRDLYKKVAAEADKADRSKAEQYRHIIWKYYYGVA